MIVLYAIVSGRPRVSTPFALLKAGGARVVVREGRAQKPTEKNVAAYDAAIRSLDAQAVLPFRFGTAVADEAALRAALEPLEPLIASSLERVRGCVQYTSRVYGRALPAPKKKTGQGPGAAFMAKKLHAVRAPEIESALDAVKKLVKAQRIERHDRAPLVASVYHLVAKKNERAYLRALAASAKGDYRVDTTGPWPVYAFADLG